jgi:hypothetical protein
LNSRQNPRECPYFAIVSLKAGAEKMGRRVMTSHLTHIFSRTSAVMRLCKTARAIGWRSQTECLANAS